MIEHRTSDYDGFLKEVFSYDGKSCYICVLCNCGPWHDSSTIGEHFQLLGTDPAGHRRNYQKFLEECQKQGKETAEVGACWNCGTPITTKGAKYCTECGDRFA